MRWSVFAPGGEGGGAYALFTDFLIYLEDDISSNRAKMYVDWRVQSKLSLYKLLFDIRSHTKRFNIWRRVLIYFINKYIYAVYVKSDNKNIYHFKLLVIITNLNFLPCDHCLNWRFYLLTFYSKKVVCVLRSIT